MLLEEAIQRYINASKVERKTTMTVVCYERNLSAFLSDVGNIPVEALTSEVIQGHIAKMLERQVHGKPITSSTILKRYAVIRSMVRWLHQARRIPYCATDDVKPPRLDTKLPHVLTDEQIVRIMKNLDDRFRDRVIFEFFLTTGCRLNEVASLKVDDLNFEGGFARVFGKGQREGIVPLSKDLMRDVMVYLQRYRNPKDDRERTLFLNDTGRPLTRGGVQIMVRRVLSEIGVSEKGGPHILRHTFATRYLRKGGNLEVLRKILRHRSITTTMVYTHLNNDDVRDDFLRTDAMSDIIKRKR